MIVIRRESHEGTQIKLGAGDFLAIWKAMDLPRNLPLMGATDARVIRPRIIKIRDAIGVTGGLFHDEITRPMAARYAEELFAVCNEAEQAEERICWS